MIGELPYSLTVNEKKYQIRTNTWDILNIMKAYNDADLQDNEKIYVALLILYEDFESIPKEEYEEAYKQAVWFFDNGFDSEKGNSIRLVDWEQDEKLIFPAINSVAGCEVRQMKYIHWWTFLGWYMEIRDSLFNTVLQLRMKKANNEKFDKWEKDFWNKNKKICILAPKLTAEEQEKKEKLEKMLGIKK